MKHSKGAIVLLLLLSAGGAHHALGARLLKQNLQLDPATVLSVAGNILPDLAASAGTLVNNTLGNTNQAVVGTLAGLGGDVTQNDTDVTQQPVTAIDDPNTDADTASDVGFDGVDGQQQQQQQLPFLANGGLMQPLMGMLDPFMAGQQFPMQQQQPMPHHMGQQPGVLGFMGPQYADDNTGAIINTVMNTISSAFANGQQAAQQVLSNNGTDVGEAIKAAVNAAVQTTNDTLHILQNENPNDVGAVINQTLDDAIRQVNNTMYNAQQVASQGVQNNQDITNAVAQALSSVLNSAANITRCLNSTSGNVVTVDPNVLTKPVGEPMNVTALPVDTNDTMADTLGLPVISNTTFDNNTTDDVTVPDNTTVVPDDTTVVPDSTTTAVTATPVGQPETAVDSTTTVDGTTPTSAGLQQNTAPIGTVPTTGAITLTPAQASNAGKATASLAMALGAACLMFTL